MDQQSECRLRQRQRLLEGITNRFSQRPEIYEIHVFGREVDGEPDEFSDIDIIICSCDLRRTGEDYTETLAGISPIAGTYVLVSDARELAEMAMLRDFSPYQKIDLSIADSVEAKEAFAPLKCIYRDPDPPARRSETDLSLIKPREGLANRMNDLLFSVPRFAKCLFRGDRDMYRRWWGVVNTVLVMLHEKHFASSDQIRYSLRPNEHKALGKALTPDERRRVDAILPLSARPAVADSFCLALDLFVDLCRQRSAETAQHADFAFAEHIQEFLKAELERFAAS